MIHRDAEKYLILHPEERALVAPFLWIFDVTRAFRQEEGPSHYSIFFLRPTRAADAQRLGVLEGREVLCVYCPYDRLEARTLGTVDRVANNYRARLDLGVSLLIAQDPDATQHIRDVLLRETERLPIVAFSFDELTALRNKDELFRAIARQHFSRDLFAMESPLTTDALFFGRDQLVTAMFDRCRAGQNSGIFGLRRIGKTSILNAIERRIRNTNESATVYCDMSSRYMMRWWELLSRLVRDVVAAAGVGSTARRKLRAIRGDYDERGAAVAFHDDVKELLSRLPGKHLVLLLDEIEYVAFGVSPASHWQQDDFLPFASALRSTHQSLGGAFTYVFAGVNPYVVETDRIGRYDNPLFSTTRAHFVRPFDFPALREMLLSIGRHMGILAEESFIEAIAVEYGGHPYLTRQACSHLAKSVTDRPGCFSLTLFESHREHVAAQLDRNARQILNVLEEWYPEEYELLRNLALGDVDGFAEFAREAPEFTAHVEGYGLVRDAQTHPALTIRVVEEHLRRRARDDERFARTLSADPGSMSQEDVRAEISRRRNALEIQLRSVIGSGLRFRYGARAFKVVLEVLPGPRREVVAGYSIDDVFKHLYFNELVSLLSENWDAFQNYFSHDRDEVMRWLAEINRCRADAHARDLSMDEFHFVKVCFLRLEEILGI